MYPTHMPNVILAMFCLTHTLHTKLGNDFIQGVSGGERKQVSIAEWILSEHLYNIGKIVWAD